MLHECLVTLLLVLLLASRPPNAASLRRPQKAEVVNQHQQWPLTDQKSLLVWNMANDTTVSHMCVSFAPEQALSLQAAKFAVENHMQRSTALSYHINWDEISGGGIDISNAPQLQDLPSNNTGPMLLVNSLNAKHTPTDISWESSLGKDVLNGDQVVPTNVRVLGAFWTEHGLKRAQFMQESRQPDDQRTTDWPITIVTTGSVRSCDTFFRTDTFCFLDSGEPVTRRFTLNPDHYNGAGSLDRIPQLESQCKSWPGPLSIALFVSLIQSEYDGKLSEENAAKLRQAVIQVSDFMAQMSVTYGACQPDVLLAYEVYKEEIATWLFPINLLRNYARLQARTELIMLMDVDLVVSRSMQIRMFNGRKSSWMVENVKNKLVYIVPAFELVGDFDRPAWADALSQADKDTLLLAYERNWVMPFRFIRFQTAHRLTNFTRWKNATADYGVRYEKHCEPWIIGHRVDMPWHDERYRGFGLNKMQHLANLAYEQYRFRVLHDVFTIHRPHRHGRAKNLYYTKSKGPKEGLPSLHQHNLDLYHKQGTYIMAGTFKPRISICTKFAAYTLPWWKEAIERRKLEQQQQQEEREHAAQQAEMTSPVPSPFVQQEADSTVSAAQ